MQTANKITLQIPKNANYGKKNTRSETHKKNISYPEARNFIENFLARTYASIAKPTNNSTQNQGMMTHFDIINLIKELKTQLELLRESLTNLTTKPHAGPDHPCSNETEDLKKINQTKTSSRHPSHHYKTQQSSTKKIGQHRNPTASPQKEMSLKEGI